MEKKVIKVNYSRSGVNTLDGFGALFIVIGFIAVIAALVNFSSFLDYTGSLYSSERDTTGLTLGISFLLMAFGSFLGGAICKGLSGIARSALYQRLVIENKYEFFDN